MNEKEAIARPEAQPQPKEKEKPGTKKKLRPRWVWMLLWLLRMLIVPVLSVCALLVGLWIGYSYIGGAEAADIWKWSTWKHLFDLVFAS